VHYAPEKSAIIWKIKQFGGGKEFLMRAELGLPSVKGDDEHGGGMTGGFGGSMGGAQGGKGKRPINVKFEIPYFTTSGIQVRYLKIIEPKVSLSFLSSFLLIRYFFPVIASAFCSLSRLSDLQHASATDDNARCRVFQLSRPYTSTSRQLSGVVMRSRIASVSKSKARGYQRCQPCFYMEIWPAATAVSSIASSFTENAAFSRNYCFLLLWICTQPHFLNPFT
jgi:hypothetical protein